MAMVWFRVVLLQGIVFQSEKSRWTCVEGMRKQSLLGSAVGWLEELAQISLGFVGRLRGWLIELAGGLADSPEIVADHRPDVDGIAVSSSGLELQLTDRTL